MPILAIDGLVKTYGRRRVVDGVSLEVETGEIVGLLGPNGAGKTTSFKMMCGLVKPDKGSVYLQGTDVTRWPMHLRSRDGGMGYLPQQSSVFAKLSAEDNLRGMMQLLGFSRKQQKIRTDELLEQFKITHIRKSKAGTLSGGERRRLEIARCLVADPRIIMLDEPFAGIDPVTVQSVQVVIQELASVGISVLITDHAAREILQITDRTYVVSEGRILCSGTAEQIVAHDEVKKKYLGEIEIPTSRAIEEPNEAARETIPMVPQSAGRTPIPERSTISKHTPVAEHTPVAASVAPPQQGAEMENASVADPNLEIQPELPAKQDWSPIVFSKPRRRTRKPARKVIAPFKSTDLD